MPSDDVKIFSLLFGIGRHMRDEKQRYSVLHFHTLRYVKEKGRPSIHEVAMFLCVTRPAATLLVEGLVRDKLVRRSADPKDRRTVRLALTPQGEIFLTRGIRERVQKLSELFAALSKQERQTLIRILQKISHEAERRQRPSARG